MNSMATLSSPSSSCCTPYVKKGVNTARLQGNICKASEILSDAASRMCKKYGKKNIDDVGIALLEDNGGSNGKLNPVRLEAAWLFDTSGKIKLLWKETKSDHKENKGGKFMLSQGNEIDDIIMGLKLRQLCLDQSPSDNALKTLVAQSLSTLSRFYHKNNMDKEADKTHLEALTVFESVPLVSAPKPRTNNRPARPVLSSKAAMFKKRSELENQRTKFMRQKILDAEKSLMKKATILNAQNVNDMSTLNSTQANRKSTKRLWRLVHVDKPSSQTSPLKPLVCEHNNKGRTDLTARYLDEQADQVPRVVLLDPDSQTTVQFGRQGYMEALQHYRQSVGQSQETQSYGWVRLDCELANRTISRRHAQLKYTEVHRNPYSPNDFTQGAESGAENATGNKYHAWVIYDLQSTNGILVNGVRVLEYVLKSGDIISFGTSGQVQVGISAFAQKRPPTTLPFVYRVEKVIES